ncbi:MAG: flagellar basal-body MS-ring/collar protein FliF [Hoeflea sp. D1-CHI-28]
MNSFVENLRNLGRRRLLILGGTLAALVAALLLGLGAVTKPDYAPVYQNLSVSTSGSVETTLLGAGFPVRVSDDGSSVLVPRSDLARARMVLAETGVPIDGDPGWELFDDQSGLAMNSFMQSVNKLRAMEGELARSIQTLDGVQSARVHLVIPEREPFSRDVPVPRASIIVRPVPGRPVSRKQAIAIRNLVASSVADLDLRRVTVLSASGETILAEGNETDGQITMQSAKTGIEDRLSREIQDILTARVGAGNARVRVNADLTTHREVVVEQSFDPDQQVVRSTENNTESQSGTEGGNVGVENNIPAALLDGQEGASTRRSISGETVTYEIGNTRREIVKEAGEIKRLSVAVLINGIYSVEGSDVTYSERTEEELQRLEGLIKSAVGFDEQRGDSVSVDSMRFMDYSMEVGDPITLSMSQQISRNIVPILRGLLALLVVGLVVILGVRPALKYLSQEPQPALPGRDGNPDLLADASDGSAAMNSEDSRLAQSSLPDGSVLPPKQKSVDIAAPFDPLSDAGPHEYVEALGVRGNLLKARVEGIQKLADERPDQVLKVLRTWLMAEAET